MEKEGNGSHCEKVQKPVWGFARDQPPSAETLSTLSHDWSVISEILSSKAKPTRAHSRFQAFLVLGAELTGKECRLETIPLLEASGDVCWPYRNSTGTRFAFKFRRENTNMQKFCFVLFVLFRFWKTKAVSKSLSIRTWILFDRAACSIVEERSVFQHRDNVNLGLTKQNKHGEFWEHWTWVLEATRFSNKSVKDVSANRSVADMPLVERPATPNFIGEGARRSLDSGELYRPVWSCSSHWKPEE